MKRIFAWVLTLMLVLGLFAGCGKKNEQAKETSPATTVAPPPTEEVEVYTANDAMDYLKALYPQTEEAVKTAVDFERPGLVRVGGVPFTVVWSTDLPEDQIKIVPSEDGTMVTIDINEDCAADTPYVLTATITDEQGNVATGTWDCILPQAIDMVAIVKEAYALKSGESLPYEVTLRGKITNINTAYNPEYQNITVTIAIEGAEDMPIECYRLKGDGVDKLQVGNIITVTGTLKNYQGKIEFDAGCILDAAEKGDAVDALTDVGEILKAAYKLKDGKSLGYTVELTGTVTEIDQPYDPSYKNISVVIEMEGYPKYPILCYRLKGSEAENIAINDLITVSGLIKNYKGTIEFDAGCQLLKRVSGGGVAQKPSDDEDKILKDAKKLGADEKLPYVATLTGQVFSVDEKYSSQYDNITVTIKVSGTRIKCFHMKGDGVSKVKVGDTITVTGTIVNYKGETLEFSPATMTDRKAGNGKIKVELGPVSEDQTYYAEMKQATLGKNLYFNGKISNSGYLQTSDKSEEAVKINVEEVSGKGTRFYFDNSGTKTYIELKEVEVNGEAKQRAALVTEPTKYWNYDSELKVYFFDVDGVYCALGTYSNYDTISATKLGFLSTKNIGKSQFVVKYVTEPSTPPEQPDTPDTPVGTSIQYVKNPVVGTAYKFVMNQASVGMELGFTGDMSGFYYATSDKIEEMVDVYLEETTGGYHIYFMKGNTKTYLNVIPRDNDPTKTNVVLQTAAQNATPSVYEINTDYGYVKTACVGDEWYLGTYGSNKTISASKTSYISDTSKIGVSQFIACFAVIGEGSDTPDEPEQPTVPTIEYVANPVAGTAYKFVMNQAGLGKQLGITGEMSSWYYATTEDTDAMVDVYLEEATGGYHIYFMKGDVKTYLNVIPRDSDPTKTNVVFQTAAENASPSVYELNTEFGYVKTSCVDAEWYLGTYGTNVTISASKTSYIEDTSKIGVSQFVAWFATVGEGSTTPDTPQQPTVPTIEYVANPVAGTAYKFVMNQAGLGKHLGITGEMSSWYYATTEDTNAMVDVYLEEATGGYKIYFMKGNDKVYLNVIPRDSDPTKTNVVFQTAAENASPSVYELNTEFGYVKTSCVDAEWYLGTYGTNVTISASKTSYISDTSKIGVSQFVAWFATVGEGSTTPDTPQQPTVPTIEYVANPVAGTAYKFVMNQAGVSKQLGLTGEMNGWYYGTTEDTTAMVDVYLEEATGGYKIYFMKGNDKVYLNVIPRDSDPTKTNVVFQTAEENASPSVYELNTEFGYVKTSCVDAEWYLGTYGTNVTIGASKTSYIEDTSKIGVSQFVAWFATIGQGTGTNPQPPVTPDEPEAPAGNVTMVTAPVAGTAYKLYLTQNTNGKTLLFNGNTESETVNYRLAMVEDAAAAVDVYLEETTGGYHLYFMNGNVKTYIRVYERTAGDPGYGKGSLEFVTTAPAEVLTYNSTYNTLVYTASADNSYFMGTYSTYSTISVSNMSYLKPDNAEVTQFPAHFGTVEEASAPTGVTMVTAPVAGTAYKLYLTQNTNGQTLLFNGQTESETVNYRLAMVEDAAAAVDVYLEETTGGYHLYFMNGNVKTYIRVYERTPGNPGYGKGSLEFVTTAPAEVLTYNSTYNTLVYTASADNSYFMGTYSTYSTISVSNMSYLKPDNAEVSQFPAHFGTLGGSTPSNPSNPSNPGGSTPETPVTPPAGGSTLTIAEAIAMGTPMEHNTYTAEKYLITGVVDSIEHTVHGNMYIKDEAGNKLYVYGVYDATGTTKYGDMATKPVAGDTVTLLSAVGNYSENAQLKNACLIEHVPSGNPAPEGPVIPEGGVSIDLTVIDNRTAYSHSQQVWEQNGIKLTNNKAGSTTNVGDYWPIRLYKGSETIIEYADMTKVVFDCTNVAAKNVDSLEKSLKATSGITVTRDGQIITVVLPAAADSFTFIASDGQCRTSVVYVYTN